MADGRFISYLRVSTKRQGESGLGLEAQRKAVTDYLNGGNWQLINEVVEVETGKRNDRPQLIEALRLCRVHRATLVIAKLDRLSRDAHFLLTLQKEGVNFVAVDMPHADKMTIGILAMVAEREREAISERTKAALAAAKARGTVLGGDRAGNIRTIAAKGREASLKARIAKAHTKAIDLAETIAAIRNAGGAVSLRQIAAELNNRGIPTSRGGEWSAVQVSRLLHRIDAA